MRVNKFTIRELCVIEKGETGILKAIPGEYPLVVTSEERKSHNEFQFDDDAVIIPLVSGTGHGHASIKRIHYQTGKFALGSILCAVIPKDKSRLNAEYLYYFLDLNRENELVARMRGMANVTLPMKEIGNIEIPLPKLEEQIAFVNMYKLLCKKGNDLSLEFVYQLSLVKKLQGQLLQEAIQGKLIEQNLEDEPANVLLDAIRVQKEKLIKDKPHKKEKELSKIKPRDIPFEIPKNWVWCKLGEISNEVLGGYSYDSTSYSKTETDNQVVRLGNVKPNKLVLKTGPTFISDNYAIETKKARLYVDDILITMTGTRAKKDYLFSHCLTSEDLKTKKLYLNQRVGCIRFGKLINSQFINVVLKNYSILKPVFATSTGAANQANIGIVALKEILIPFPPLAEQYRIVKKLEQLIQTCGALESSIKESQKENERLLQQVLRESLGQEIKLKKQSIVSGYEELGGRDKYRTLLLAAEIIWQLNQKQTLGHIKLQKLIYLCNRTQRMNLPVNFLKWAMGPYDPELQKYIDTTLVENEWFKYDEDSSLKYQPLRRAGGHKSDYNEYFSSDKVAINHLIQLFENAKSARIEIVATLFACWEDLIKNNQLVNDSSLLVSFYNWSEKKKKYSTEKVIDALRWMEIHGLTPESQSN